MIQSLHEFARPDGRRVGKHALRLFCGGLKHLADRLPHVIPPGVVKPLAERGCVLEHVPHVVHTPHIPSVERLVEGLRVLEHLKH